MSLDLVLNELSLSPSTENKDVAYLLMNEFIATLRSASKAGMSGLLRTSRNFNSIELAPNYYPKDWLRDKKVFQEQKDFFLTVVTAAPYLDGLESSSVQCKVDMSEFLFNGQPAKGLGIAHLLEALAVSFRSDPVWNAKGIELNYQWINDESEIITESVKVVHASQSSHIQEHLDWIKQRRQDNTRSIQNGSDLWKQCSRLFPHLVFCESIATDLQELDRGNLMVRPIIDRLLKFESYCAKWEAGAFNSHDLSSKVSLESRSTLDSYEQERTFQCPDGEKRVFSWHARLTPGAWRIYFYPETDQRKLIIGYIGTHLKTVKYH